MGSPEIYDNADRAAIDRYNAARASGLDDAAARQQSYEEWWRSSQGQRRANGIYQFPGMFGDQWAEWVPESPVGGSPASSGSTPTGGSPMGSSVGGGPPPAGGSPMATSFGAAPAPAPSPAGSVGDARMAVGLAGLSGGND